MKWISLLILALSLNAFAQTDTDGDGVLDGVDNCISQSNADQTDTDGDGFGNACDGDYNNDTIVNLSDFSMFLSQFGGGFEGIGSYADCDGNEHVTAMDFSCFLKQFWRGKPGDSALNSVNRIYFPQGACETAKLEIFLGGIPFSTQFLDAGKCVTWFKNDAIANMVVRCIDPTGVKEPSAWVKPSSVLVADTGQCG